MTVLQDQNTIDGDGADLALHPPVELQADPLNDNDATQVKINPALREALIPLSNYYNDMSLVEMRINKPGEVVLDHRKSGKERVEDDNLDLKNLTTICRTLANINGFVFDPGKQGKLSCVLPEGHRFEALIGNSAEEGISLSIRCKHPFDIAWSAFNVPSQVEEYISQQIKLGKNIIISGATNTGKTTLANLCLSALDDSERVVACEDTPELDIARFWDGKRLLAAREEGMGDGLLTWRELYDHLMRITPDRVIFGEISTQNAEAALNILNAGITGFLCTLHAENQDQVIHRKFTQIINLTGKTMPDIPTYLQEMLDIIIQIKRDRFGKREITDIYLPKTKVFILKDRIWKGADGGNA